MAPPCCNPTDIFFYFTFHYRPNVWAALAHTILFALATVVFGYLNYTYARRTDNPSKYMHILTFTALMEAVGYGFRIYTTNSANLTGYIVTTLLILISPIALAVVNYVVVGKLLRATGKQVGFLKASHVTRLFLASDVFSFIMQGGAGGLLASKDEVMQDIGKNIVLIGLAIQTLFFTMFVLVSVYIAFHKSFALFKVDALKPVFSGLFLTITCLYIRNIYRFVEFASGIESPVVTSELIFNMFETLPIFVAFCIYGIHHFGKLLPKDEDIPALIFKGAAAAPSSSSSSSSQHINLV